jgi:hypothetical protein
VADAVERILCCYSETFMIYDRDNDKDDGIASLRDLLCCFWSLLEGIGDQEEIPRI